MSDSQIRCAYSDTKNCGSPYKVLDFGFVSHYHGEPNVKSHIGSSRMNAHLKQGFGYALPEEAHMLFSSLSKFP